MQTVLQQHDLENSSAELRVLTAADTKRLESVCKLLQCCTQQSAITPAQLRSALTAEEYSDYQAALSAPTTDYEMLSEQGRPDELTRYIAKLKVADLSNARADSLSKRKSVKRYGFNRESAAAHYRNKSEAEYEKACECLEEILSVCNGIEEQRIRAWLDRDFDNSINGLMSNDCVGVARVIGSRSPYCRISAKQLTQDKKAKKAPCQLAALRKAASDLLYVPEVQAPLNVIARMRSAAALSKSINSERD